MITTPFLKVFVKYQKWQQRELRYRHSSPARHKLCEDALASIYDELNEDFIKFSYLQTVHTVGLEAKVPNFRAQVGPVVRKVLGIRGNRQKVFEQLIDLTKDIYYE
jgi:hypothetical protein